MLATAWDGPFSDPAWYFEPKWDGVRCIAEWNGHRLSLTSRTGREMADTYPELGAPAPTPAVLDGEIVALDADGRPSFQLLQSRLNLGGVRTSEAAKLAPIVVFVFDLLEINGVSMEQSPLAQRRARLEGLELSPPWHRTDGLVEDGEAFWEVVGAQGLEGLVAKRLDSPYRQGVRSAEWRKIVRYRSVKALVCGFTPGEGGRSGTFGSLLLGLPHGGTLRWIGSVGTGFDDRELRLIRDALDQMVSSESPFPGQEVPAATFVDPRLVAHVRFKEWTDEQRLRHPSFKGFGPEDPETVTWEAEGPAEPR